MRVQSLPVGEALTVVIVLLLAEAEGGEGDIVVGRGGDVVHGASGGRREAEVFCDDGQGIRAVAPVGVADGCEVVVIVAAPLRFTESCVTSERYPVRNHVNQRVLGGA